MAGRGLALARTFVELADTLTEGYDAIEHLHMLAGRFVELLDLDDAGILLNGSGDTLRMAVTSREHPGLVELVEMQSDEGPGLDAFRSGEAVTSADLNSAVQTWPRFAPTAIRAGYAAVHALPMRLRVQRIGAVVLLRTRSSAMDADDAAIAQALADVATIGMVQHRVHAQQELLTGQLQTALNSRVVIEQAKGVLAERRSMFMEQAFEELRTFARSHNRRLSEVAYAVVQNAPDVTALTGRSPAQRTG